MVQKMDANTKQWIAKQEQLMDEGQGMVKDASDEALEYLVDAVENINDKQWRKMVMETQIIEMGIGVAIAEYLVPQVYEDMRKHLHKRLKVSKDTALALKHIYIGRTIKNIRRTLDARDR